MATAGFIAADGTITDPYRNFIAVSRYARWVDELGRRETWTETVERYIAFFRQHLHRAYDYDREDPIFDEVRDAILNHHVMPSMRAIMTAGPALERSSVAAYNCSFIAVNDPRAFDEAMFILLNGTGVGFSVERRHVEQLPMLADSMREVDKVITVEDSKEGWVESFRDLLQLLWQGEVPTWDTSAVRPAGARLNTFGGRASGPGPLEQLFAFAVELFDHAHGRHLTPVEAHDLMCKVGDVVVSGGVRRSALISLSDLGDYEMAKAKSGTWWETHGHRALANNSAVYTEKPSVTQFLDEWRNLIESNSGERGIFNLEAARRQAERAGRDAEQLAGTNPCGEILLRDMEFCNLSEVVIQGEDTEDTVAEKVRLAAIIGTWQSTLTDFKHLRPQWKANCEEERLLGVSLTGIYGNQLFGQYRDRTLDRRLRRLREAAHQSNAVEAAKLGINPSKSITCVKPSGTVSQLAGVSSGIHPWHAKHYVRTVRGANTDPLTKMLIDSGVPAEGDVMKPDVNTVFSFPIAAPKHAITREEVTALDHIKLWSIYRDSWCDHNPSVTINVREQEWLPVGNWVYSHWSDVAGIAFLPHEEHSYQQAPYQECTAQQYADLAAVMPTIHWGDLTHYEREDGTSGSQELACVAGACEIVDIKSA